MGGRSRRYAAGGLLLLLACDGTFIPLRGKIEVGEDPMVVFVGGDAASGGDLYAVPADGGAPIQLTYSAVGEMRPAVSPDGRAIAFLRAGSLTDSTPASVWIMSLTDGAERRIELPAGTGVPARVGWADAGRSVVVRAGDRLYRAAAPPESEPARPVVGSEQAAGEATLEVRLGDPVFGRAQPCPSSPRDLCVVGDTGGPALFAREARDPARWGGDSVAYLEGDRLVVRPLGSGRARSVQWHGVPTRPRQLSVFPGSANGPR